MQSQRLFLIEDARSLIGQIKYKRYRGPLHGQDSEKGLNCYGYIDFVAARNGAHLPRGIIEMWERMEPADKPQVADLVFYNGRHHGRPSHVGFYDSRTETLVHLSKQIGTVAESRILDTGPVMGFRSVENYLRDFHERERI